jgi:uncharacterized protein YdbL (DUF1318 family)
MGNFPSEHGRLRWIPLAAIALLLLAAPTIAWAGSLGDAKAKGWVGEQADGFVGIVDPGAPADVKALVASVNERRAEGYRDIAKENGTSLAAVAALAGERNIGATQAGHFVKRAGKGWEKK